MERGGDTTCLHCHQVPTNTWGGGGGGREDKPRPPLATPTIDYRGVDSDSFPPVHSLE